MKKWAFLAATATLTLSLAACGGSDDSDSKEETKSEQSTDDSSATVGSDNESEESSNATVGSDETDDATQNQDEATVGDTEENTEQNSSTVGSKIMDISDAKISYDDARKTFDEAYPDVKVSSIELDDSNGKFEYEFSGFDETDEYQATVTEENKLTKEEKEAKENDDTYEALMLDDYVTFDEAVEKASEAAETDGYTPTGWSLEFDDGTPKYTIQFEKASSTEVEVELDAKTGEQLSVEKD